MSKGLRLPWPLERIAHHRFDQIEHSQRGAPIGLYPKSQILSKLRLENGNSFSRPFHRASLGATPLSLTASVSPASRVASLQAVVARSGVTVAGAQSQLARRVRSRERVRHRALLCVERSPFPVGPQPDREHWPGFHADLYKSFRWPSISIRIVQDFCTSSKIAKCSNNYFPAFSPFP